MSYRSSSTISISLWIFRQSSWCCDRIGENREFWFANGLILRGLHCINKNKVWQRSMCSSVPLVQRKPIRLELEWQTLQCLQMCKHQLCLCGGSLPGGPACCYGWRERGSSPPCTSSSQSRPPAPPPPALPRRSAAAMSERKRIKRCARHTIIIIYLQHVIIVQCKCLITYCPRVKQKALWNWKLKFRIVSYKIIIAPSLIQPWIIHKIIKQKVDLYSHLFYSFNTHWKLFGVSRVYIYLQVFHVVLFLVSSLSKLQEVNE